MGPGVLQKADGQAACELGLAEQRGIRTWREKPRLPRTQALPDREARKEVASAVEGGAPEGQVTPQAVGTVAEATLSAAWGRTMWVGTPVRRPLSGLWHAVRG